MNKEETLAFVNNTELSVEGEIWKEHPVYKNYWGSNFGRVKYSGVKQITRRNGTVCECNIDERIKGQYIKNKKDTNTLVFTIDRGFKDRHYVYAHKFICECFNGISDKRYCLHLNGCLYDNRIENLEWSSTIKAKSTNRLNRREYEIIPEEAGEKWKLYSNNLWVSNLGKIKFQDKSNNTIITKGLINRYGYYYAKGIPVHRMVAALFLYNPESKKEVNHIDGNPANNHVNNLEWCTRRENMISYETHKINSRPVQQIDAFTGKVVKEYISIRDAVRANMIGFNVIKDCCENKLDKVDGFIWRYKVLETN